jgi:asparagine N-glycosylation enzyme membrane subunit Stt3
MDQKNNWRAALIIGDILVLALVTVAGFASHGTAGTARTRMMTTFVPLLVSWFLVSPYLRVFDEPYVMDARQLWRPFWAMVLAGPMAAFLRGAWLNTPILPLFVVVLGGISAISLLVWRALYFIFAKRMM